MHHLSRSRHAGSEHIRGVEASQMRLAVMAVQQDIGWLTRYPVRSADQQCGVIWCIWSAGDGDSMLQQEQLLGVA